MAGAGIQILGLPGLLAGLDGFMPQLALANQKAMSLSTHLVEYDAKARVRRKTGRLFASITSDVSGAGVELTGSVGTNISYGADVEEGTHAHDISPVAASALMIPVASMGGFGGGRLSGAARSGQQVAFFSHVRHPGSAPHPYLVPALEDNRIPIQAIFTAAAQKVLAGIAAETKAALGFIRKL